MGVETRNIFWGDYQLFDTNILCFDASNFSNLIQAGAGEKNQKLCSIRKNRNEERNNFYVQP